ncbi:hypothetical protein ABKS10_14505 [Aeromonas caviae]|uniref:hypothetical protein n=1 Tax=Aeromonas caviae TaxID=648 RepID=UPI0032AF5291
MIDYLSFDTPISLEDNYSARDLLANKPLPLNVPNTIAEIRKQYANRDVNKRIDDKRLVTHKLVNISASLSKHQHILQAMRQSIIDKGFSVSRFCGPSRPSTRVSPGKLGEAMTLQSICPCCYLPINGNSDGYCNRQMCIDVRMAAERNKLIAEHGQYLVQWETLDAQIKHQRFADKDKAEAFYVGIYADSVSAFLQYPDGRILE